jgi:hypothetical protein
MLVQVTRINKEMGTLWVQDQYIQGKEWVIKSKEFHIFLF